MYIKLLLCALLLIATPAWAQAYFTTDQDAFTINGKIGVYTIQFAFGHADYDITIPIHAYRRTETTPDALSFKVMQNGLTTKKGDALGIVLADLPRIGDEYIIKKGTKGTLRLVVLYTRPEDQSGIYSVGVTHLPFAFGGTRALALNPSELRTYVTPKLPLIPITVEVR